MAAWDLHRQGITDEMRRQYRHGVLHCTAEDVKAAATTWLKDRRCNRTAFAGNTNQDLAGLRVASLIDMAG
jgi:Zn-dependent M16 (insulinase) family peptidase